MIYLDHNATTAPAPAAIDAMLAVLTDVWANASSQHGAGQQAKRTLAAARATIAGALGCKAREVVFTSGATEANHLAVLGLGASATASAVRRRLVFGATEHAAQLKLAHALAAQGRPVDFIAVRPDGVLDLDSAARVIGPDVALVSVMAANNETGVLMPITDVKALAQAAGALLHVDATQLVGKLPFDFAALGADAVSLSAHKLHGPKGIGALLVRDGVPLAAQFPGSQERHRRGGTENLPAIVGFAAALERLADVLADAARIAALRDAFEAGLRAALPGVHVYGASAPRLPGTSCLRVGRLDADTVLQRCEQIGVCASSGSACSSGGSEPSHVLSAMGVPRDEALGAVRFSLGAATTARDIDYLLAALPPLLKPLLAEAAVQPT
ncbi:MULTISPECIES: cysteine desulfurase family protein [Burkholderia cepacia complex]|jgi:cysteine desulfurase|uniref:Cysteine desulfurase NifS n=1 Tax=Burkholderia ubonensis TaxID=101571 RepID=A0A1B4LHA5_9BURK|nr:MULTISPECIES: cysteine desulfurase family protein [Burkholderia cepacia complex]AOJ76581.1 cysteine desulfurase NifS [Burkholderia ubonensis]AOK13670.1 cysteine desulfurase NifS [Burkholderia vietnamiensis]KVE15215.1 cysteine desulfurase NifS [Burkholderia vietnamiensis]KVF26512.1 cysteine desulfurase NifS [Burkholderia vietnamiensis]KVF35478.1 cysteine desulfurase NifS [Burkholderia vietnamiensis]